MDELTLRPACEADYEFCYHLHREALGEYVDKVWGWRESEQRERFGQYFDHLKRQVIVWQAQDVGALELEPRDGELYIAYIALLPEFQGRGIGTHVIDRVLADAFAVGQRVTLRVLRVNERARRLYESLGFEVTGETPERWYMGAWPTGRSHVS